LIDEGYIEATGKTNARTYSLKTIVNVVIPLDNITRLSDEDIIWRFQILPHIKDVPQNVVDVCQYGFTEMLNNVIDHSVCESSIVSYEQTYTSIAMMVVDNGIGIFQKIQNDFDLPDPRSALLELSKGKLTSDKDRHTGEGVFFTSRMFDSFIIKSGNLFYIKERQDDGWLIEVGDISDPLKGTVVQMEISTHANWTYREVFDHYQDDNMRFRKTHVPIVLGNYPGEQLISRSQAKRILTRFEQFSEVMLDFRDVDDIGQPFADQLFRVFRLEHPEIKIFAVNMNDRIQRIEQRITDDLNSVASP